MKLLDKYMVGLLVVAIIGMVFPQSSFCDTKTASAKVDQKNISRHAPVMMSTPEEDILPGMVEGKGGVSKWVWIGLGVAVVGGLAAAGGGGGGGGGDPDTGTVSVGW